VLTNVEVDSVDHPDAIREILIRQLTSPVQWVGIVRKMAKEGVECIVEIGPNKVLTGLNKRIEKDINSVSLDKAEDMEKVLEALAD
jgi:[acyl-carrier-protein] S-malonyltransferase